MNRSCLKRHRQLGVFGIDDLIVMVVMLAIAVGAKVAEYHWKKYDTRRKRHSDRRAGVGASYALDIMDNDIQDGGPLPVVVGRHRVGGRMLQLYTDRWEEGVDRANALIAVSEGPISKISEAHIDGNAISNYAASAWDYRTGTNSQTTIVGFDGTVTSTALNTQLTYNTAVTASGTVTADRMRLKVTFPTGTYYTDDHGGMHSTVVSFALRYRTTAGPGAWQTFSVVPNLSSTNAYISDDSLSGTTTVYIANSSYSKIPQDYRGDVMLNPGGTREEKRTVTAVGTDSLTVSVALTYDHYGYFMDRVYLYNSTAPVWSIDRRRTSPYSVWIEGAFPSADTYDVEIKRITGDHSQTTADPYLKEYQEIADDEIRYVNTAVAGVRAVGCDQTMGGLPRFTFLVDGVLFNEISSATLVGAAAWTQNPADIALGMIYNRRWGALNDLDPQIELTMTATALEYTVGETVTGPTNDYQFRGTVVAWDGTTEALTVSVYQGFPHGVLTGATSGKTATVSSVDDAHAVDLASFYDFKTYCNEMVPDGTGSMTTVDADSASGQKILNVASTTVFLDADAATTVDADSAAAQKVLNVASTTGFAVGDKVLINSGGAREECGTIASIQFGVSLTLVDNLTNQHTAVQADAVEKYFTDVIIDFEGTLEESGTIDTIQGGVSITLVSNLTYTHTAVSAHEVELAEVRATFNFLFEGDEDFWAALGRVARCSRAIRYMTNGNRIAFRPLRWDTPTFMVTKGSILSEDDGSSSLQVEYPETGARPNRMSLDYMDEDMDYKRMPALVEDPLAITNDENINTAAAEFFGITRASQAHREAWHNLKRMRYVSKRIRFRMQAEALGCRVGALFYFGHDLTGDGQGSGHIATAGTVTTFETDHPISITTGDIVFIRFADGTIDSQTLADTTGTYKHFTTGLALAQAPAADDEFIIVTAAAATPAVFRVMAIEQDADFHYTIVAEEESSSAYAENPDTVPTYTPTTLPDPDAMPDDVTAVTATEGTMLSRSAATESYVDVDWYRSSAADQTVRYEVWQADLSTVVTFAGATNWASGTGNGEFNYPAGICTDGTYVYVCDAGNHRIQKFTIEDLTYVDSHGSRGTGNDQFQYPCGICTDGTSVWICDKGNHRIVELDCAFNGFGGAGTWTTLGTYGAGNDQFKTPYGICHSGAFVYVTDMFNYRIVKIDDALVGIGGGTFSTFGAQGAGNDQFERPTGICVDSTPSYLYIGDSGNHRLVKLDVGMVGIGGGTFTTIGSYGTSGNNSFNFPAGTATDDTNVYVCDAMNDRVHTRLCSDLSYIREVGTSGDGREQMDYPQFIDHYSGQLFLSEANNHRIGIRYDLPYAPSDWTMRGETAENALRVTQGISPGENYRFAVVSKGRNGTKKHPSDAPYDDVTITATGSTPPNVANAYGLMTSSNIRFWWDVVRAYDLGGYEIRYGSTWATGMQIARTSRDVTDITTALPATTTATFYICAFNTSGAYSATAASVAVKRPSVSFGSEYATASAVNQRT